SSITTR
ncbi:amidohydrolase family protein, partial [Vibrio parahaemolyticus AQ3810]